MYPYNLNILAILYNTNKEFHRKIMYHNQHYQHQHQQQHKKRSWTEWDEVSKRARTIPVNHHQDYHHGGGNSSHLHYVSSDPSVSMHGSSYFSFHREVDAMPRVSLSSCHPQRDHYQCQNDESCVSSRRTSSSMEWWKKRTTHRDQVPQEQKDESMKCDGLEICRVCNNGIHMNDSCLYARCSHCEHYACFAGECISTCVNCSKYFCTFCSMKNYDSFSVRVFCLDCSRYA